MCKSTLHLFGVIIFYYSKIRIQ